MAHGPRYRVRFRRRREGRTDYKRRLALIKSGRTRAVVRKQNRNIIVQFVEFEHDGDRVKAQATAQELSSLGWTGHPGNLPAAYLAGLLAGKRAIEAGIDEAVLDIGEHRPVAGGALFAALQGLLDAGVDVPHGDDVLPDEERISGIHISDEVTSMFETVKTKIEEGS